MNPDCPKCGAAARLATKVLLDLYRCTNTKCRHEFYGEQQTCAYPSCASLADDEASGRCWFHARQIGVRPEHDSCGIDDCESPIDDYDRHLCWHHAQQADIGRDP